MSTDDLDHYLREVAALLGKPWRGAPPQCTGEDGALVGPQGSWVSVTVDSHPAGDRLVFETWLIDGLAVHQPSGTTRPVVTVARSRPPEQVARDLRRRLLPKVRDLLEGARNLAEQRRRDAHVLRAVLESVAARLGADPKPGAHTVAVGEFGRPLYATAQVLQPTWRSSEHIVRFSIDAAPAHALALAELLGDRAFALYGTPDE
ncbi:hypothetical protein [Amycolatopsis anabasis]|uniref:hypothetical protein n=1 Tax=Amycolatopsis anabasis TaxID=1840409 RepID=UPI00131CCE22|nr:hypothetical protein [Amycolatopsis anabasis]